MPSVLLGGGWRGLGAAAEPAEEPGEQEQDDHRPLGSIMRARLRAYEALSRFRREMNARPRVEPHGIDEIPG